MIGSLSEMTCFSFYATKTLTTGEGGMLTTDNDSIADRIRIMRLHGIGRDAWKRYSGEGSWYYEVVTTGFKYNTTDIMSAIGLVQLGKCDAMLSARALIAQKYNRAFSRIPAVESPTILPDRESAFHLYILRLNCSMLSIDRNEFIRKLKDLEIGVSVHFIPLHMHSFYRETYGYTPDDLPIAAREFERCLSLPLFPDMTGEQVDYVIENVSDIAQKYTKS